MLVTLATRTWECKFNSTKHGVSKTRIKILILLKIERRKSNYDTTIATSIIGIITN